MRLYLTFQQYKYKVYHYLTLFLFFFILIYAYNHNVLKDFALPLIGIFLLSMYFWDRSLKYKYGKKAEERIERLIKNCVKGDIKIKKDVKINYGNIDFMLITKEKVLIIEVKAGKFDEVRTRKTIQQVLRQINYMKSKEKNKKVDAVVVYSGQSKTVDGVRFVSNKELCSYIQRWL